MLDPTKTSKMEAEIKRMVSIIEPFAKIYDELEQGSKIVIIKKNRKQIIVSLAWFNFASEFIRSHSA